MKIFHCDHCHHLLFFENTLCVSCGRQVVFVPEEADMRSIGASADGTPASPQTAKQSPYRLCRNYSEMEVCNWAVGRSTNGDYCPSCCLTEVIPDLAEPSAREAWYRLEAAKRRLVFTLLAMNLPITNRLDDESGGLGFEFKSDPKPEDGPPVLTGHNQGVITINIAEADDAERERRRKEMHEPYRTLLGHMRHESGHYYWDRLVRDTSAIDEFRATFGDERADYGEALRRHYAQGAPPGWQEQFVSAYASTHPWEDWAETWAHYLHMFDTLDTAAACGVSLRPRRSDEPSLARVPDAAGSARPASFDRMLESWFPLTYMLNNLNRGLGLADPYPFVLSAPAILKLRFVHDVIARPPAA